VIASYKPGDATKLGVDYKTLSSLNDKIIYGSVSGYGSYNDRVGYDAVVQAEAGFMFMNGERGGASLKMPVALIDVLAAHHLKEGILIALLERQLTGKGNFVEVSLIQAAVSSLVNQASNWLVAGKLPQKQGSMHPNIAPYGDVFKMKDGEEILLAVGNDKQFSELCIILDLQYLPRDERFKSNQNRVTYRYELNKILEKTIQEYSSSTLLPKLHQAKIPAGIIQNMKQVFEMEEARALLIQSDSLTGVRNYVGTSVRSSLLPPPHLGEHTSDIVQKGGFSFR
jgi:crotonobetainyl-CoA:carnitine CoA-transferase CaiB-like acyl-CoA transferase